MARIRVQKNGFSAGELSPRLLGRADLRAYENGASKLRNVFVHPSGSISRRSGLRYIDTARGTGRLLTFEFNTEQVYLLVFTDRHCDVYRGGVAVADFMTPWTAAHLGQINWTQSADTLLVVHPEVPPKKISRASEFEWHVADWQFHEQEERIQAPHYKFAADDVTLDPSGISGTITLIASKAMFYDAHVGVRFRLQNKEVQITAVPGGGEPYASASALVKETLSSAEPTIDWTESAFSPVHGWPVAVTFHQDRLVVGGSRDLPNRLWLSKSADLFNFDLGEGLDDEGIEFAILSDQVNAIRAVFSGRHLQVFTSGAEWMVTGEPLTPTNIQLNRQTRIGLTVERTVPPRDVDGATLFVPRTGTQLREFLYSDVEQAYRAGDLAMLAQHLIDSPADMDFDQTARLCHVVMANGSMATLTIYRAEQVSAWTSQETAGFFRAVAAVGDDTYVLVERENGFYIEVFDETLNVDSGLVGMSQLPKAVWSGLNHLEHQTVKVLADGAVHADVVVEGGTIALDQPANSIQSGLGYTHIIEPLPPGLQNVGAGSQGSKMRPVSFTFRFQKTSSFRLDSGRGFVEIPFKRFGDRILDCPASAFSGDKKVRAFGWRSDGTKPLWRIEQDTPLPFTLLSVSAEISVNA
jgi:hypothetical protein